MLKVQVSALLLSLCDLGFSGLAFPFSAVGLVVVLAVLGYDKDTMGDSMQCALEQGLALQSTQEMPPPFLLPPLSLFS